MLAKFLSLLLALPFGAQAVAAIVGLESADVIPDSFIVVLKHDLSADDLSAHLSRAESILRTTKTSQKTMYDFDGFIGYHVRAPKSVATLLASDDQVAYIEADQAITAPTLTEESPDPAVLSPRQAQNSLLWNLARIRRRQRGDTTPTPIYSSGLGTFVYVVDTGINTAHAAFQGRASFGYNAVGGANVDDNGHGTHVAGTVAAKDYGVAQSASVIAVKVFQGGSGSTSTVLNGFNWAVNDIKSKGRTSVGGILLAVGGGFSAAFNNAVASAVKSGVFVTAAAGGENSDTCNTSPASEPTACVVGATDINDAKAGFSSYGQCVDIFAPGVNIVSTWISGTTSTNTLSGTSMAAAHIAGSAAHYQSTGKAPSDAGALCGFLQSVATKNVLTGIPANTPNLLDYVG